MSYGFFTEITNTSMWLNGQLSNIKRHAEWQQTNDKTEHNKKQNKQK